MARAEEAASGTADAGDGIALLSFAALHWLTLDATARLMIDGHLNLLWWNPCAELLLVGKRGIEVRGGALSATDAAHQAGLRDLVRDAVAAPSSSCLELPSNEGWLLLRCRRVGSRGPGLFCLTMSVAGAAHAPAFEHLDAAFDLTRAEHRVLQDLLAGNDADSLAALHGVSIETTRTHIRNIYAKVGVNSRESLFARVQGFRA